MHLRHHTGLAGTMILALALAPYPAAAQSLPYSNVTGSAASPANSGPAPSGGASSPGPVSERVGDAAPRRGRARSRITPYIEAAQVVTRESAPNDEVLTYSQIAVGADAAIYGVSSQASVSVRYQRDFGWDSKTADSDTLSGIARGSMRLGQNLNLDAGALAARTSVDRGGGAVLGPRGRGDSATQVYAVYGGPSAKGRVGDVALAADYKLGYSRTDRPDLPALVPGVSATDVFDDSVTHMAGVSASIKPGEALPVGVSTGGTYYREDISNLDQRVEDMSARAGVVVPVSNDLALVAGVGYEKVRVSSRDALRDGAGNPVIGSSGNYVTDKSAPRRLAYDTSGLIWDAGVMWRPSRRTALAAHVGRRYGSTSVYGSFAFAPGPRSSINVSVYDNVQGFGGVMTRALSGLPTEFSAVRNPLSGDLAGCVSAIGPAESAEANESSSCLSGALGSVRSSVFRGRGVMASYNVTLGRLSAGLGAGYDRRKFIGAPGTVLALYDGVVDENTWLNAYLAGRIDGQSNFNANIYANWFQSGSGFDGDVRTIGATAAYNRYLTDHLSATAALGLDGVNRQAPLDDYWTASAMLGVRYSF